MRILTVLACKHCIMVCNLCSTWQILFA